MKVIILTQSVPDEGHYFDLESVPDEGYLAFYYFDLERT